LQDGAALVFNRHVGRDAVEDWMGFDAAFVGKYSRSLPLGFHVPKTDAKHSPFLIVFKQEAGLVFNRNAGRDATRMGWDFDALLLSNYRRYMGVGATDDEASKQ
jgi:hypothetical protein